MTESVFQSKLLHALRQHPALRDAVIWKLSDRFSRGIPDIEVVTKEGRATFWELKRMPNAPTKIQAYFLNRLRFSWCIYFHFENRYNIQAPFGVRIPPVAKVFQFDEAVEEIVRRCVR